MPPLAGLLLLLAPPAGAHSPHEVVAAFAPADGDGAAWLILLPRDLPMLLRSPDEGLHWDFVATPAVVDDLVDLGRRDGVLVALAAEQRLWSTTDDQAWTVVDLPVEGALTAMALGDGIDLLAGDEGAWAGDLLSAPQDLVRVADGQATAVVVGEAGAAVALADGRVLVSTSGMAFQDLGALPDGLVARSLAFSAEGLWAGTDLGGVLAWRDGAWTACGALPATDDEGDTDHVPALGLAEGSLLAASVHEAPFLSDDGCETWTARLGEDHVEYRGMGWATEPEQAFTWLGGAEGGIATAGFAGLSWSWDEGATWTESRIVPGDHVRGLAFSPDFPEDPRVYVGGYGGGMWWTWDGGASYSSSATGLERAWVYDLQPDPADPEALFMCGSLTPYRSLDGGLRWESLDDRIPSPRVRVFQPWGDRICALGEEQVGSGYEGRVSCSADGGDTWLAESALEQALGDAIPMSVQVAQGDGGQSVLVTADQPASLLRSDDGGASWRVLAQGLDAEGASAGVAAWPPGQGSRLLFASTDGGLTVSEDGGESWVGAPAPEGEARTLVMADDGSLWLSLRGGQVYRSEDGGDTWTTVGPPLAAAVHELVPGPGFSQHGLVLAATQDGVMWTDAGEADWHRLPRFERFEDGTSYLRCEGARSGGCGGELDAGLPCDDYEDGGDGLGTGLVLREGSALRFTFSGTGFRVLARGRGRLRAEAGGVTLGELDAAGDWTLQGLEPGWRDVVLTHEGGGRLRVDAVEAWGEGEPLPVAGSAPEAGGGCGGRASLFLLSGLLWRRRRMVGPPWRSR